MIARCSVHQQYIEVDMIWMYPLEYQNIAGYKKSPFPRMVTKEFQPPWDPGTPHSLMMPNNGLSGFLAVCSTCAIKGWDIQSRCRNQQISHAYSVLTQGVGVLLQVHYSHSCLSFCFTLHIWDICTVDLSIGKHQCLPANICWGMHA